MHSRRARSATVRSCVYLQTFACNHRMCAAKNVSVYTHTRVCSLVGFTRVRVGFSFSLVLPGRCCHGKPIRGRAEHVHDEKSSSGYALICLDWRMGITG